MGFFDTVLYQWESSMTEAWDSLPQFCINENLVWLKAATLWQRFVSVKVWHNWSLRLFYRNLYQWKSDMTEAFNSDRFVSMKIWHKWSLWLFDQGLYVCIQANDSICRCTWLTFFSILLRAGTLLFIHILQGNFISTQGQLKSVREAITYNMDKYITRMHIELLIYLQHNRHIIWIHHSFITMSYWKYIWSIYCNHVLSNLSYQHDWKLWRRLRLEL